jgi:hypothetical protein
MSLQGIQADERALFEKWGVSTRYGTEIEFVPRDAKGNIMSLSVSQVKEIQESLQTSPYIEGLAREGWASLRPYAKVSQLEIVLGEGKGRAVPLQMPDRRLACSTMTLATDSVRRNIQRLAPEFGISEVSFMPVPDAKRSMTTAYHTNISLWDAQGNNLFAKHPDLYHHCADEMMHTQLQGAVLPLPTSNAFERVGRSSMVPSRIMTTDGKAWNPFTFGTGSVAMRRYDRVWSPVASFLSDHSYLPAWALGDLAERTPGHNRLENRLAGGNANCFLMGQADIGSMKCALEKYATMTPEGLKVMPHSGVHPTFSLPNSIEEALEMFTKSDRMKQMLGAELHEAITHIHLGKALAHMHR